MAVEGLALNQIYSDVKWLSLNSSGVASSTTFIFSLIMKEEPASPGIWWLMSFRAVL